MTDRIIGTDETPFYEHLARFKSHKVVRAGKIGAVSPVMNDGTVTIFVQRADDSGLGIMIERKAEIFARRWPSVGDYFVVYETDDHYESLSPGKTFEDGYVPLEATDVEVETKRTETVFAGEPDARQAEDLVGLFRTRYRKLTPDELELRDAIKAKAEELALLARRLNPAVYDRLLGGDAPTRGQGVDGFLGRTYDAGNVTLGMRNLEDAVYRFVKALTGP